ncbi:MAG: hypothetical protein JOY59_07920 [Candidatus Eremiobacteraeota bacterium]|nr:hypothetical protein [Candidatus Eremiobacteraeota bacterium]
MGFLSLDGTFWIQIINFFIFYAILNAVYIRPAAAALRKRRAYLDSVAAEYEAALRAQRDVRGQIESVRGEARREADQRIAGRRAEAQREADRIVIEGQAQAAKIAEDAHRSVEEELRMARRDEDAVVADLAESLLSRAVGAL